MAAIDTDPIFLIFLFHFQIKTTSPEKFRVRPSTGVLAPGNSANINVVLQPGHNVTLLLNKDKFLVMCMELDDANATQQDIAELWKVSRSQTEMLAGHEFIFFFPHFSLRKIAVSNSIG